MTKTYFRLIEVSAEERPERVAPAFASLAAAQKSRRHLERSRGAEVLNRGNRRTRQAEKRQSAYRAQGK